MSTYEPSGQLLPDDSREQLQAEAGTLHEATRILRRRFRGGKHDATAIALRLAEIELISRARHPSRQPPGETT